LPIELADFSRDRENETVPVVSQRHCVNDLLPVTRSSNHCAASDLAIKEVELLYSIRSSGLNDYVYFDNNNYDDYDLRFMFEEKSNVDCCILAADDCSSELCLLFEIDPVETVDDCIAESCETESNDELFQLFDVVRKPFVAEEKESLSFVATQNEVADNDDDLSVALHELFYLSSIEGLSAVADSDLSVRKSRGDETCLTLPESADDVQRENCCRLVVSATNAAAVERKRLTSHGHVIKLSRITGLHFKLNDALEICLCLSNCFVCGVDILIPCCYAFCLPLIRQWKMRLKFY